MAVRLGIIGVGYWGPNLVRNFNQIKNAEVISCADLDERKLLQIQRTSPNIYVTTNYRKLLDDKRIDAIILATPSNTHAPLGMEALRAKKHIFVEKPFTLNSSDAEKLLILGRQVKKIIMVGHTYEYHPAIIKIKHYLAKNQLGQLFYIYCSRLNMGKVREETNALWNLAPHDISILLFLLETMPLQVSAFGQAYLQRNHEDVVFINLLFPKNIIAHVHVSWLDPSKERKITLVGDTKMVVFDDLDPEASLHVYKKRFLRLVNEKGERIFKEFALKLHPGDINLPYVNPIEPLQEECRHFVDCIINKKEPRSGGVSGYNVVKVLESAEQSLKHGGSWIPL